MTESTALHVPAGGGLGNAAFDLPRRILVTGAASGGAFTVFEEDVPEGFGPPLHVHRAETEFFRVLEGRVRFHCEGREFEAGPGDTVLIPAGARHAFKGLGPGPARTLVVLTPGGFDRFFVEVEAAGLRAPADMTAILEVAGRHGIDFVGPPLD